MVDLILYAVAGAVCGIFINYLADVLPVSRKFSIPICSHCSTPFSFKGYLFSFKCHHCGMRPTFRTLLVLIASIILSILVGIYPLHGLNSFWLTLPLMVYLGVIMVIDIQHHVILIQTSIVGLILFAIYGFFIQGWLLTLVGGTAGLLIMLVIYYFGVLFTKGMAHIRKEDSVEPGMGFGDVYVCTFLGFLLGWPYVIGMIILAILLSGIYSFIYLLIKAIKKEYQAYSTIPYAPFLIISALAIFYLPPIPGGL